MGRKRHSAEEVINKLRQADVELGKGGTVAAVCKQLIPSIESTFSPLRRRNLLSK